MEILYIDKNLPLRKIHNTLSFSLKDMPLMYAWVNVGKCRQHRVYSPPHTHTHKMFSVWVILRDIQLFVLYKKTVGAKNTAKNQVHRALSILYANIWNERFVTLSAKDLMNQKKNLPPLQLRGGFGGEMLFFYYYNANQMRVRYMNEIYLR